MRCLTATFALVGVLLAGRVASAQVPLDVGFGGPCGYGTQCLAANDDCGFGPIDVRPAFPSGLTFFSGTYTSAYVNNNGNFSFGGVLGTYTPSAFPGAPQPMIAPYWADVYTGTAGCEAGSADSACFFSGVITTACPAATAGSCQENYTWYHLEPGRIVVTWDRVGYYYCNLGMRMSFQLILSAPTSGTCTGAGDFDVEFRFNRCEWEAGDASGGTGGFCAPGTVGTTCTPAQAGFDSGDGVNYVSVPGSRMAGIATVMCTMSNVGMPGVWQYQIRSGTVICPGAGTPCSTGMPGVCDTGRMECVGAGTSCVQSVRPSAEVCDGLDNDCNGTADDGNPCPAPQICVGGHCTDPCIEGCGDPAYSCVMGRCVETACIGVTCPAGQRCSGGACIAACDGVVCPIGQSCIGGVCVDLCSTLTCDDCTVCVGGSCVQRCTRGATCAAGQACAPDGRCVDAGCDTLVCPTGQVCQAGACIDACTGAVCPSGQTCTGGQCVAPTLPDGGMGDGGTEPGNEPGPDAGTDGIGPDAGTDGGRPVRTLGHCGCRFTGGDSPGGSTGLAGIALFGSLLGLAIARRVRRPRRDGRPREAASG